MGEKQDEVKKESMEPTRYKAPLPPRKKKSPSEISFARVLS